MPRGPLPKRGLVAYWWPVLSAAAARTELLELMQRAAGFRSAEITAPGISQRLRFRSIDFGAAFALRRRFHARARRQPWPMGVASARFFSSQCKRRIVCYVLLGIYARETANVSCPLR